jgi:hypothetical protein
MMPGAMKRVFFLPRLTMIVLRLAAFAGLAGASLAQAQVGHRDQLIAQAKSEGRLVWYTTLSIPESKQFADIFEKQFPFIRVEFFRSGAGAIANRIFTEYSAKNYRFDVLQGVSSRGVIPTLKQKEIIGKYESPEYKSIPKDLKDKDGYWASNYQNTIVLAYNKRMVKPEDVPKTYDDLLKPIWKGKKILNDSENYAWFDGLLKERGRDKGLAYFSPVGAARAVVSARRPGPRSADRGRRVSPHDSLRAARAELHHARRAGGLGGAGTGHCCPQYRPHSAAAAAPGRSAAFH